jgi:hypothetical protein
MGNEERTNRSICAKCPGASCYPMIPVGAPMPSLEEAPGFCPMRRFPDLMEKVEGEYAKPSVREFARLASVQEPSATSSPLKG